MSSKKKGAVVYELIPTYDTGSNDEVDDEIDVIINTYENVKVSGKNKALRKVCVPLASEFRPERKVQLELALVAGYPYVPPQVRLIVPGGVQPSEPPAFTSREIEHMKKDVHDNIQPCLSSGIPCMMQIISTVASTVDGGLPSSVEKGYEGESCSIAVKKADTKKAGQSPSLTPIPLKAKEALKLSLFTLHLLRKCCHLKDPESNEEANSNFEWIASYLFAESDIFLPSVHNCVPWRPDVFAKAFSKELQAAVVAVSNRNDIKKWLWEDEGHGIRLQQGTEGRYQNEFIEQRLLGSGGFAPVYVCRKKIDGRLYAIKKVAMSGKHSERVIREVQTLSAVNHKNIVRYYDAWVEDGCSEELRHFIEDEETEEDVESESEGSDDPGDQREGCQVVVRSSSSESDTSCYTSDEESTVEMDDESDTTSCSESESLSERRKNDGYSDRSYQTLYIQMELCAARSLRHLIDDCDTPEKKSLLCSENGEKVAASILRQLLSVTAHTHHECIVHRDLKPDNVLFEMGSNMDSGEIGTIRVADFGLARVMSGAKRNASSLELADGFGQKKAANGFAATGNCGSVLYCAPEQEKGLDYDFKVDEFSVGMIALEMWLAIAGKGFRDRFNIMEVVWRTGNLPDWFCTWNPGMAGVIGSLLELDPRKRSSCAEMLSTAELPGDPADIVEALDTIGRYGERIAGRVIQRIQKNSSQYRKPTPALRESARFLGSNNCTDISTLATIVGMLHGATAVTLYDVLAPMNPTLSAMGVESVVDSGGRCFCFSNLPHYSTASFLGMQENGGIGSFYQFYNKSRPYVIFTTPLSNPDVFNELIVEPLLCLYHLLSYLELTDSIELVISHADWLNTVYPKEVGPRVPPNELCALRGAVGAVEKIGPDISRIGEALGHVGMPASYERDEFLRKYVSAAVEVLSFFGGQLASSVRVVLDPALNPGKTVVHLAALDCGVIVECRAAHGAAPLAFGCALDNFTSKCTVVNTDISAFSMNIDIKELVNVGKHVNIPFKEGIFLDGVVARRHDFYSQANMGNVIEAAVSLWRGNIRACIRVENDTHALARSMKHKRLRWILLDGRRIIPAFSSLQNKAGLKQIDIPLSDLRGVVRGLSLSEKKSNSSADMEVLFLSGKSEPRIGDQARKLYETLMEVPPSLLLIAHCTIREVEACYRELDSPAQDGSFTVPALGQWLKTNLPTYGMIPVFSSRDGLITLVVNHKRFRVISKEGKGGKKK